LECAVLSDTRNKFCWCIHRRVSSKKIQLVKIKAIHNTLKIERKTLISNGKKSQDTTKIKVLMMCEKKKK